MLPIAWLVAKAFFAIYPNLGAQSSHHPFGAIQVIEELCVRLNVTQVCDFLVLDDTDGLVEVHIFDHCDWRYVALDHLSSAAIDNFLPSSLSRSMLSKSLCNKHFVHTRRVADAHPGEPPFGPSLRA